MGMGGCWGDVGWIGGGLEEGCKSIGGALEEDGPPKYGLGTPQYGDYVATSWKNDIFCQNDDFLTIFPLGRSNCVQIRKNNFSRFFGFLPPYFGVSCSLA